MIPYTIISEVDISYAVTKRIVLRVSLDVDSVPSKGEINDLVSNLTASAPDDVDEYTIFGYLPDMETDGPAYLIAEVTEGATTWRVNKIDGMWEGV